LSIIEASMPIEDQAHLALLRIEYADTNETRAVPELNIEGERADDALYERMRRLGDSQEAASARSARLHARLALGRAYFKTWC